MEARVLAMASSSRVLVSVTLLVTCVKLVRPCGDFSGFGGGFVVVVEVLWL